MKDIIYRRYARFWAIFNKLPYSGQELKREIVRQYTNGRTEHLHEMTYAEYELCCNDMAREIGEEDSYLAILRKHRSTALHLLQPVGVDTTDWNRVNDFCRNTRIAGNVFARLDMEELDALCRKLRAIAKKPPFIRKRAEASVPPKTYNHSFRDDRNGLT